uniref:Uncharacterized protein n=1 Tax=Medicago truncatula TaxID=3880 RepID=I3SQQ8_MEDTR|nr:unknown [Medicago truncatula]
MVLHQKSLRHHRSSTTRHHRRRCRRCNRSSHFHFLCHHRRWSCSLHRSHLRPFHHVVSTLLLLSDASD